MIRLLTAWRGADDSLRPLLDDAGVDIENAKILVESVLNRDRLRPGDRERALAGADFHIYISWESYGYEAAYGGADVSLLNRSDCDANFAHPVFYPLFVNTMVRREPVPMAAPPSRFCNAFISNARCAERGRMLEVLNCYRRVHSHGRAYRNSDEPVGADQDGKLAAMAGPLRARFNFCAENTLAEGYVTEKPAHAFLTGCVPVWSGLPGPLLAPFVNEDNTIILNDLRRGLARLLKADRDEAAYRAMLAAAPSREDVMPLYWRAVEGVREAARRKGVLKAGF